MRARILTAGVVAIAAFFMYLGAGWKVESSVAFAVFWAVVMTGIGAMR